MTAKELLKKVKGLFNEPAQPAQPIDAPAALATYKLADGTEVSISGETIEVGSMVTIGGAQAPSGDYELADGRKITVDATGAITLIVTPEPVTQPDFVAPPTLEERIKSLEDKLANLNIPAVPTGLATEVQLQSAEKKIAKQDEVINGLFELVEQLTDEPTTEPKTLSDSKKQAFEKRNARDEKFKKYAAGMKAIKVLQ